MSAVKFLDLEQNTPEWMEWRNQRLCASDIGILMEGSNDEIRKLYYRKASLDSSPSYQSPAMKRGHDLEPIAREKASRMLSTKFEPICVERGTFGASLDGFNREKNIGLEIKCPMHIPKAVEGLISYKRYMWQIQTQIYVSNAESIVLFVYDGETGAALVKTIYRDEKIINKFLEKSKWFYDCLLNFQPPYEQIVVSDQIASACALYEEACKQKKIFEDRCTLYKEQLLFLAKGQEVNCGNVVLSKIKERKSIDYKKACADNNIDLSGYVLTTTGSWKITVKTKKETI